MSQHDQVIDNSTGLAVRTDINLALQALFSSNSGAVEPAVIVPGQIWFDTSTATNVLKVRNQANSAWITVPIGSSGPFQPLDTLLTSLAGLTPANGALTANTSEAAGIVPFVSAAQFKSNVGQAVLALNEVWAAAAETSVAYASSITLDMQQTINVIIAPSGPLTLQNPTNQTLTKSGVIRIFPSVAINIAFGTQWIFAGTRPSTLAAGTHHLFHYYNIPTAMFTTHSIYNA